MVFGVVFSINTTYSWLLRPLWFIYHIYKKLNTRVYGLHQNHIKLFSTKWYRKYLNKLTDVVVI